MPKIKVDAKLFSRAKKISEIAGYSSIDEFMAHIIEREIKKYESEDADKKVAERLRGLGYIE